MPDTEEPARPPTAARPSLMGGPDTPTRASATTDAGRMRMLDELEAVVRPRPVERSSVPSNWLIALLAFGVVLVGLLWWTKHRATEAPAPVAAVSAKVASAPAPVPPAASAPAVIETVAAATPPAAAPDTPVEPAPAPTSASTPAAAAAPAVARAAVRPAVPPAKPTPSPAGGAKVTTVTTASGGKWTVTVADASAPANAAADKPLPSPASAVAAPLPARAAPPAAKGDDADVRLLSALLAHVSRPAPGATLADEDQLTIAQVVKRCDARPAAEVRECRRRICEGYWGKAEACPVAAAKKG